MEDLSIKKFRNFSVLIILVILLIVTVRQEVITKCNYPYINNNYQCCLDLNYNKICDFDEKIIENPHTESPVPVVTVTEKIIYLENECRKFDFSVNLEACIDDEITFHNLKKGILHYADVKLYDKKDRLIDERRFRTQLGSYSAKTYHYEEVENAVKAIVTPTVEFDDEDIICPEKTFELKCYGDDE